MKPAVLRPQALRDQQDQARYCRKEAGTPLAVRVVEATNAALDQIEIEIDPGIGSPVMGKVLAWFESGFHFRDRHRGTGIRWAGVNEGAEHRRWLAILGGLAARSRSAIYP